MTSTSARVCKDSHSRGLLIIAYYSITLGVDCMPRRHRVQNVNILARLIKHYTQESIVAKREKLSEKCKLIIMFNMCLR